MLVFLVLGNAKELSFALGDAKVPNAHDFASQWNIGLSVQDKALWLATWPITLNPVAKLTFVLGGSSNEPLNVPVAILLVMYLPNVSHN